MSTRDHKRRPQPTPSSRGVDIDIADVWAILQRKAARDPMLTLHMENARLQAALDVVRRPPVEESAELELVEEEDEEEEMVEEESGP